jgi:hypothetical protein
MLIESVQDSKPDFYQRSPARDAMPRPANREEEKSLVLSVLAGRPDGTSLGELLALQPELSRRQLQSLLKEL